MGTYFERPPETAEAATLPAPGGLSPSRPTDRLPPSRAADESRSDKEPTHAAAATRVVDPTTPLTLSSLPVGARLVLRCRKDWRTATVSAIEPDCVRLLVASPTGHAYRVRRPADSALVLDGLIPVLCDRDSSGWRVALARYDARW